MANEQTSVPLYAASEVLTAANMNISAGTGVPVFATTVTRDAAFGGASEKVLAEGQLCYLSSTNVVQQYNGSGWETVGPVAAASSGLVCVKAETAFTASATVSADSVFTSTYTNYLIKVIYTTSTTDVVRLKLRVGGVATSTNYNRQEINGAGVSLTASSTTGTTSLFVGEDTNGDFKSAIDINLFGPQLAQATLLNVYNAAMLGAATSPSLMLCGHNQSSSTQFDGFELLVNTGTTTGTYAVYGYSKAV